MQPNILKDLAAKVPWTVIHPLSEEDSVAAAGLRSVVVPLKGKFEGTAGPGLFNDIIRGPWQAPLSTNSWEGLVWIGPAFSVHPL